MGLLGVAGFWTCPEGTDSRPADRWDRTWNPGQPNVTAQHCSELGRPAPGLQTCLPGVGGARGSAASTERNVKPGSHIQQKYPSGTQMNQTVVDGGGSRVQGQQTAPKELLQEVLQTEGKSDQEARQPGRKAWQRGSHPHGHCPTGPPAQGGAART